MQDHEPQPGDRVKVIASQTHGMWSHEQALLGVPTLVVQHQMPYEPGHYMLSDGKIYAASQLHLVQRPEAVQLEFVELDGGRIHTRLAAPKAAE